MGTPENNRGWFKSSRGEEPLELIAAAPLAYVLAAVIAHRARWKPGFNRFSVQAGEAFLGDYWNYGMTEQTYRTAKRQLEEWGFATFRATNKGTIGKLTNTRLFVVTGDAANEQNNTSSTNEQRTTNEPATNEQRLTKKGKNIKRGKEADAPPVALPTEVPTFEPVKLNLWPREYDSMIEHAKSQIKAITSKPDSYVRDMTDAACELIALLETEKKPGWQERIAEVEGRSDAYERKNLKPKFLPIVAAWKDRIREIERAKAGIKNN